MHKQYSHIRILFLAFFLLYGTACSTKKKSWVNRQYHNTAAKYNGYFNGNESLKMGVKKLHSTYSDDFTTTIPVFPTGDLKKATKIHPNMTRAIKKGSVVIQRHSMKIKGKEYCKWIDDNYLLVGKAYFYKGDFEEAIKTFSFIINEYKKNEIRFESSLWLVRSFVEKRDFTSAKSLIKELSKDRKFPEKLERKLTLISADLYLRDNDFIAAEKELITAIDLTGSNKKNLRLNYILAQLYQYSNNYALAKKHYKLVLKSSPEYEMAFNAKMNLARSLEGNDADSKKIRQELLKMIKDDKNIEYLDQLYYTLALMDVNIKDTISAKEKYLLSALSSVENVSQKSLSYLALAKLYFSVGEYNSAYSFYDSTITYMNSDFRLYEQTNDRKLILEDLVLNMNRVELEDSLQMLSNLSVSEQSIIFNKIIQDEFEQERIKAEEERLRQQNVNSSRYNSGRGDQFGNNTSGGNWYFYNPATISFGVSEFRKKWGSRKLEDNWRRKDKKNILNFDVDTSSVDSSILATQNTKDPKYYFDQLPKTNEDFINSDSKIKESLYQLGLIYRDGLDEINLSTDQFSSIYERFPKDQQYASLALYNMYLNYEKSQDIKSDLVKSILLSKYSNSIYAKSLADTSLDLESLRQFDSEESKYNQCLSLYKNGDYIKVINLTEKITSNKFKDKYLLLRSLSFIKTTQNSRALRELSLVSNENENLFNEAQYLINSINNPLSMNKANEQALAGSSYLFSSNSEHMVLLVLPRENIDITYLQTLISDFHLNNIGIESFEISSLLLGSENHLIMIKSFENARESLNYVSLFKEQKIIMDILNSIDCKIMCISLDNFPEFYKNNDAEGYHNYFINKYLTTY
jgi:tetratricopeptide (TPR) repeat protein